MKGVSSLCTTSNLHSLEYRIMKKVFFITLGNNNDDNNNGFVLPDTVCMLYTCRRLVRNSQNQTNVDFPRQNSVQ